MRHRSPQSPSDPGARTQTRVAMWTLFVFTWVFVLVLGLSYGWAALVLGTLVATCAAGTMVTLHIRYLIDHETGQ